MKDAPAVSDGSSVPPAPLIPTSDAVVFVAMSLLPVWTWRDLGDRLRAGANACDELDRLLLETARSKRVRARSRVEVLDRAQAALACAEARGLTPLLWTDSEYPALLAATLDPPPVLWYRGNPAALDQPAVAIVGSRAATPYGLDVATRLGIDLAARGVTIVSGLARGVDSAAHRGALSAGGRTIAVLGCGADVVYPREHAALAHAITASGLVLSELVPGTLPLPQFFPQRNRIISGLSRAVVVVEAGERSGSLITARCALEQGRDVLAVPGNVLSGRNRGGHALLRDGAKIVEVADDILEELGMRGGADTTETSSDGVPPPFHDPVLEWLPPGETCDLDLIAERSGQPPARLLSRLLELELEGRVRRVGAGRFVRFDRSC
jgi:DNA processing protein